MEAESFFARWARHNAEAAERRAADAAQPGKPQESARPPPTLEEVAQLTPDSDFAPFLACGVDEHIRRSALKKLFADPHFNAMDGLDVYIEDYSRFEAIPAAMLAALDHAQALLNPHGAPPRDAVEEECRDAPPPASDAAPRIAPSPSQESPPHDDPL